MTAKTSFLLQIPIRTRFLIGTLLMLLPLVVLASVAIYSVNKSSESLEKIVEKSNTEVLPVISLQKTLLQAAMPPNDFLIDGSKSHGEKFRNLSDEIDRSYESLLSSPAQRQDLIIKARQEWETTKKLGEWILSVPDPLTNKKAKESMLVYDLSMDRVVNTLDGIVKPNFTQMEDLMRLARKNQSRVYITIVIVFATGLSVAITTGLALAMSVIYPVRVLSSGAEQLGEGNLSYRISLNAKDEFGGLAGNFNSMAEKIETSTAMLHQLAIHDGLTGLFNNREFYRRIKEEVSRYRRFSRVFSLLIIDLDEFKSINDRLGHQAGDAVLSALSKIVQESVRDTDFVARYGGDEFAVILCDTSETGAFNMAERIRKKVNDTAITIKGAGTVSLTMSIGMASISPEVASEERLIAIADNALYRAKNAGRNRTCVAASADSEIK